jgi:serine/threonine protein kinase
VRAQPRKFVIGAEDLAHETALLACLDHPNIITLYGRAEGCFSTAFQMRPKSSGNNYDSSQEGEGKKVSNEGYFIILDRLMATLTGRIDEWMEECQLINGARIPSAESSSTTKEPVKMPSETNLREHLYKRLKVAYCIADALEYLHSRHVVFRDLKPANVGFDCNDCVKMFDFGFATSIAPLLNQEYQGYGPLTETCGTRRYMAPEVALKLGYGKEVDVYSFGMLLWEICVLEKPFDSIQSVEEFHDLVVLCGKRPSLHIDPLWTSSLKHLMSKCWSTDPLDRPTMVEVKSMLCNVLRDMNVKAMESKNGNSGIGSGNSGQSQQQNNFMKKWRRRVSI